MLKLLLLATIFLYFSVFISAYRYRQERAVMRCNPRAFSNCTAITARLKRGEPYKTNVTFTTLQAWNNNVTMKVTFKTNNTMAPYKIQNKLCEIFNLKWIADFVVLFSDLPAKCPVMAATYHFVNIEMPPRNFPLPIPEGRNTLTQIFYITDTHEVLSTTTLTLIVT